MNKWVWILLLPFLFSCNSDEDSEPENDNFDRKKMLENWADNIIIPSFNAFQNDLEGLQNSKDSFIETSDIESLNDLRSAWEQAYTSWQRVSMFEIGKAEEITLRDYVNIYPVDTIALNLAVSSGIYNLELPSTRDIQGFAALDYLLFGIGDSDQEILSRLSTSAYMSYLAALVDRLVSLNSVVIEDWNNGYRDTFVNNSGSDASSSVNKLVNDYMFYYEKVLRAGKIGIPAGVFSSTARKDLVEAPFKRNISKKLCLASLDAVIDFYKGRHFNSSQSGESLRSYLEYLNSISEGDNLGLQISNQFDLAREKIAMLDDDFVFQIENNNSAMLEAYDALQSNVILMKVDMFQAMNIRVDYVDADGD